MLDAFFTSFKVINSAVFEIMLLGLCGFALVRRKIIPAEGLNIISKLIVEVTLPFFVFSQLILRFNFLLYPQWYIFPVLSLIIASAGFLIGLILLWINRGAIKARQEFLALVTFQNSGYLVLPLVTAFLPKDKAEEMLIYLFLFLLGFNLLVWSAGVYLVSKEKRKVFELGSLFTPVVSAILLGLLCAYFKVGRFIPGLLIRPLKSIGDCTIPLAMLVVGGNLALTDFSKAQKWGAIFNLLFAKLVLLPAIVLLAITRFKPAPLVGLLIMIEAAVPSATSLSIISRHYHTEDVEFINQGIFWTHLFSIFTLPFFLSLFFALSGS